jgi:hypothetical protein
MRARRITRNFPTKWNPSRIIVSHVREKVHHLSNLAPGSCCFLVHAATSPSAPQTPPAPPRRDGRNDVVGPAPASTGARGRRRL